MLPSQIKLRVKRQFGDESGAQLKDADIIDWINEAQREIYTKNNLGMKKGTVATIIGTSEYAFPNDLMRLFNVKYDGNTLQEISQQDVDEFIANYDTLTLGNGTPTHYWTYADKITLYPVPDSVKNLTIRYNRTPSDIVADDSIPLDLDLKYHNRVLDYCHAQAAHLDNDMQKYTLFMQRFEGKVNSTKDDETEMAQQAVYSSISVSTRDAGEWPVDYYSY